MPAGRNGAPCSRSTIPFWQISFCTVWTESEMPFQYSLELDFLLPSMAPGGGAFLHRCVGSCHSVCACLICNVARRAVRTGHQRVVSCVCLILLSRSRVCVAAAWFLGCQCAVGDFLPCLFPSPPIYVTLHHLKNKKKKRCGRRSRRSPGFRCGGISATR